MRLPSHCGLCVFGLVLALLAGGASAQAAGSAIDPDPATPSLGELLQREEDARARLPLPPARKPVPAPVGAASATPGNSHSAVKPAAAVAPPARSGKDAATKALPALAVPARDLPAPASPGEVPIISAEPVKAEPAQVAPARITPAQAAPAKAEPAQAARPRAGLQPLALVAEGARPLAVLPGSRKAVTVLVRGGQQAP